LMKWLSKGERSLEHRVLREISSKEIWRHIQWLSENVPQRLAGSPEERRAVAYLKKTLEESGLDCHIYDFDGYVSFPGKAELRLIEPERRTIKCAAYAHIASTQREGIEGELVYVRSGGGEDYHNLDARGKITLAELSYAPPRPEKVRLAQAHGAAGQIQMNWGEPDSKILPLGTVKSVWGNPTPEDLETWPGIPVVSVGRADGLRLKGLCEKGRVRVWLRAEATKEWRRISNVVAELKGVEEPEKFVIVGGHFDAWGGGVTCNATGNSLVLELARVLARHRKHLRRSVRFAFWTAHETGIMEGSTWYVDNFWDDLKRNAIAYLNCDSPGMKGTVGWTSNNTPEIRKFRQDVVKDVLGEDLKSGRLAKTGDQSFFGLGLPAVNERTGFPPDVLQKTAGAVLSSWYHSTEDTMDKVDMEAEMRAARVYATSVLRLCNSTVLPFEFVTVVDEILTTLGELQAKAKGVVDLSTLIGKAERLKGEAARLSAKADEISKHGGGGQRLGDAARVNDCLMGLSRILNPMLHTAVGRYGQDRYGASYLAKPIPVLQPVAELASLDPNTPEYKALRTKMVRETNKVSDALDEASSLIGETIKKAER
jgi:hypothetical protein